MQAGYLAKAGKSVAVLERREVLGGAAVTEEIVPGTVLSGDKPIRAWCADPGFKFSRASYLLSLLRPQIVKDLDLKVCIYIYRRLQLLLTSRDMG